jgi:hypothetical protein
MERCGSGADDLAGELIRLHSQGIVETFPQFVPLRYPDWPSPRQSWMKTVSRSLAQ